MVSRTKLYAQLDRLEQELSDRVIPHLEWAANGKNDLIFCATDFNPFPQLKAKIDPETDFLILLGRKILALREKLDESSEATIAERICFYCVAWGKKGDLQGKAAQALARQFLDEISNAATKL